MSFISLEFVILVVITFFLYYSPIFRNFQVAVLVVASVTFYSWDQWRLIPLLMAAVLLTHFFTMLAATQKRWAVVVGVASNLAILAFFKYKFLFITPNQLQHTGNEIADFLIRLPLPIGISFFIFHNISLIVDFYKEGAQRKLPTFIEVLLYILFFPQLVSGPITRSISFLPQIEFKRISEIDFGQATKLIILGLFFKLFVANNLAQATAKMAPEFMSQLSAGDKCLLVFVYSAQIYADFLGYSTIALGLALLYGYRLPVNFNLPYIASSFSDFWSRWHISLSKWLRTYLYIPLGGNRVGSIRTYLNLLIVMGLGGLWHGAAISYLLWGLFHGLFLAIERFIQNTFDKLILKVRYIRVLNVGYKFLIFSCVSFLWIFFRFTNFSDASRYISEMASQRFYFSQTSHFYQLIFIYASPVAIQHLWPESLFLKKYTWMEGAFYGLLLWLAVAEKGADTQFIYFRF